MFMKKIYMAFDFDGTIVSSMSLGFQIYEELAEKYKLPKINEEELIALNKLSIPERLKMFNIPLYKLPKLGMEFKKSYQQFIRSLQFIEGMMETLVILKEKGFTLGIISSNSVSNIKQFFANNNMDIFDHVYSSKGLFGKHTTINNVSKKNNIRKEDIIYIGDELRDIHSCQKAGVKIIAVTWGFDSAELLKEGNPDFIAHEPSDIIHIMNDLLQQK